MNAFPIKSIEKAKEIAALYKKRFSDKRVLMSMLFENKFLEIHYGFEDCIKYGRGGSYLHEVDKDAECFSLAGIHYLVAKELGLKPKIYWATKMRDVWKNKSEKKTMVADHCFIIVEIGKKRYVLDMFHQMLRPILKDTGYLVLGSKENNMTRKFSSLAQLTEEEYVQMMEKNRSPESMKAILFKGQAIKSSGIRVNLSLSKKNSLLIGTIKNLVLSFNEETQGISNYCGYDVPILKSGELNFGESNYYFNITRENVWDVQDVRNSIMKGILPNALVSEFRQLVDTANKKQGRKKSLFIAEKNVWSSERELRDMGIKTFGGLEKDSLIDSWAFKSFESHLYEYVDEVLVSFLESDLQDKLLFEKRVRYLKELEESNSEFIYSKEELNDFLEEYFQRVRKNLVWQNEIQTNYFMALSGMKNMNKVFQEMYEQERDQEKFDTFLTFSTSTKKKRPKIFYSLLDYTLFFEKTASRQSVDLELIRLGIKFELKRQIFNANLLQNKLALKNYRTGLKRILRENK